MRRNDKNCNGRSLLYLKLRLPALPRKRKHYYWNIERLTEENTLASKLASLKSRSAYLLRLKGRRQWKHFCRKKMFTIDLEGRCKRTDPLYNVKKRIVQVAVSFCFPCYTTFISFANNSKWILRWLRTTKWRQMELGPDITLHHQNAHEIMTEFKKNTSWRPQSYDTYRYKYT